MDVQYREVRLRIVLLAGALVVGCSSSDRSKDLNTKFCTSTQAALALVNGANDESKIVAALETITVEGLTDANRNAATTAVQTVKDQVHLHYTGRSFNGFTTKAIVDVNNRLCETKQGAYYLTP